MLIVANKLVIVTGIIMLILILILAQQQSTKEARDKIYGFAVLMLVGTVFWMLYQIGYNGVNRIH